MSEPTNPTPTDPNPSDPAAAPAPAAGAGGQDPNPADGGAGPGVDPAAVAAAEAAAKAEAEKVAAEAAAKAEKDRQEANKRHMDEAVKAWDEAAKADPDIGGEKFATALVDMEAALKVGNDAIRGLFKETGLARHPEVIRFLATIGKSLREGTIHRGDPPKGPRPTTGEVFYGKAA